MEYFFYLLIAGGITFRFALWKLFGREDISISKKSIRYQQDFGFIRFNPKTIEINDLGISFQVREQDKAGLELGNLLFYSHDELDQVNLVFESSINMKQQDLEEIENHLKMIEYDQKLRMKEVFEMPLN